MVGAAWAPGDRRRLPDLPDPRQHRYLPACGRRAAPGLRALSQAAAGRVRRGLRLAPPNFPSPSVGRGGSRGGQAGRDEARSLEPERGHQLWELRDPTPARRCGPSAPRPQRRGAGPAGPPITAPATARPAGAPAPADEGAGGSDLKTHSPQPPRDRRPEPRLRGREGTAGPTFPGPASAFRPPTQHREEKFGTGETAWEASFSSLVINSVHSGRYRNPTFSLPGWRKEQRLSAPHPPDASSLGDRRPGLPSLLCPLQPGGPYCAVQPHLGDGLFWASVTPSVKG